jgi:hypothetical protein
MERRFLHHPAWDGVAAGVSLACAFHCALTPIALVVLPVLASTPLGDEGFHRALLWLILPSSGVGLTLGCRRHKDAVVMTAGVVGLSVLVFTALAGHDLLGEGPERLATVLGSLVLATGHARNHALCRRDRCER